MNSFTKLETAIHKNSMEVKESLPIIFFVKKSARKEKSTSKLNGEFIFYQSLIHCLFRLKYTRTDKTELLKLCKSLYKGNRNELNNICNFEEQYSFDDALLWYTKESFFYKALNEALRTQDIHMIFLFREFISDIQRQLQQNQMARAIRVYRSQMMANNELDALKRHIGQFISNRSFFSTSMSRETALFFLGNTSSLTNMELKGVLFEIDANPQISGTKPFADISECSHFINESEILFMIGSIFHLENIRCDDDNVWVIQMSLCSEHENDLKEVLWHMKQEIDSEETNLRTLAKILWKMGKLNLAEKYLKRSLKELSPNDPLVANLYKDLSELASYKRDYDSSVRWKQRALQFKIQNRLTILNMGNNLETYSLLWLDVSVNCYENWSAQQQLRSVINHMRAFNNVTDCENYIRSSQNDQMLLVTSGRLGPDIVPLVHSFGQVHSIYIYCSDSGRYRKWSSNFNKIQAIVTGLNELIEKVKIDGNRRARLYEDHFNISIFNSMSNEECSSTDINGNFLRFQLVIDGLLRLPYSQQSRHEFFNLCRNEYQGNNFELSILQEFEKDYISEKAVYWYTRHSFLYKMLNKALRVQNFDVLFLFRFFMQDLYQQLKNLQQEQNKTPIRVYRGQLTSKNELNKLVNSKGQFVSMNSFLSTTLSRRKSLSFISSEHDNLCRMLLEIDVDISAYDGTKPFANISSHSHFENEQEILFMIGSILRIVDIREEHQITVIHMQLCNENYDHDMKLLFQHMQIENDEYGCLSLGHTLRTAEMYDQAEQFYYRMLDEMTDDHPLAADLWSSIGIVKRAKGEIEASIRWLRKSFKRYEQQKNPIGRAKCLQDLGNIHQKRKEFNQAIDKYKQALNIFKESFGEQHKSVANCLNNLGVTYFELRKFPEAIQYYLEVLSIRKNNLPRAHPDNASILNNIGNVYYLNNEYDRALEYFNNALDIFNISLPSDHPAIAKAYYNIGLSYLKKRNDEMALDFLNRATSIYRKSIFQDDQDLRRCINTIDYIKKTYNKRGSTRLVEKIIQTFHTCNTRLLVVKLSFQENFFNTYMLTEYISNQTVWRTEHVQLAKYRRSIEYMTVESAYICCNSLIDFNFSCHDGIFIDNDPLLQIKTAKRRINLIIFCLDVKLELPDIAKDENVEIISFYDANVYVSEVVSIKDKLVYAVVPSTLSNSVVPMIHNHTCIESIYIYQCCHNTEAVDWMKNYPKICNSVSSTDQLTETINEDIDSMLKRPSRWSRSKTLLRELCLQTSQSHVSANIYKAIEDDLNTWYIVILYLDSNRPFHLRHPKIKIEEFFNIDECVHSIQVKGIPVFLVISMNKLNDIRSVAELDAVRALYIVGNLTLEAQTIILSTHLMLSGIFVLNEDLIKQIIADICFHRHAQSHTSLIIMFKIESYNCDHINENQTDFLCFQFFSYILPELPIESTSEITDQLLSSVIQANSNINYLFNRFNLFTLRKSIAQLKSVNQQIVSMSADTVLSFDTVYRAQLVSSKDLNMMKDNLSALLTVRAFVFASCSFKSISAVCRRAVDNKLTVALFEIKLSDKAFITYLDSETVLFGLGTIFRLLSINNGPDNIWRIRLETANMEMHKIRERLRIEVGCSLTWLTFVNYLVALKRFNEADNYYEYLQQTLPRQCFHSIPTMLKPIKINVAH